MNTEWLKELKPGCKVYIGKRYASPLHMGIVNRLTATLVYVSLLNVLGSTYERAFRRKGGMSIGPYGCDDSCKDVLVEPTPENHAKYDLYQLREKLVLMLQHLVVPRLDKEGVEKLIAALEPFVRK